ncbi:MAG: hypothetical protein HUU20_09095 [Pirellulales bacterium]|nr:hypothetical protein [Pirellulales bacterium]
MSMHCCRPFVLWILFSAVASAADVPAREELGRSVKLRILVDKVMQPTAGWVTQEWMVKATADAGFNVLSPRHGHERPDEVRQVAAWCKQYGIYYMPWMRGSLGAPAGPAAEGRRMVWANGGEQALWSPNSDEFWQWTRRYIVEYARISRENRHLMGVFLDYENYTPGGEGNLYSLSYDDGILAKFAKANGIDLPKLAPRDRKPWLEKGRLHDEFARFQVDHWRERCRELRKAVDEHDPTFQFCIYPAPGTPFMVEATYPEWSTQKAPLILADPWVYGRPSQLIPQKEALELNRDKLIQGMEIPKKAGIPFIYSGGIDPIVRGADPEFSGKNAVMISEITGGYWIFYEGPTYTKQDHADYWKWFTWANRAIAAANWQAWHEPRETPENWDLAVFHSAERPALVAPEKAGATDYTPVRVRHENLVLLACKAQRPVEVELKASQIGPSPPLLVWEVRNPALETIASLKTPQSQAATVKFTPDRDGVFLLGASAGGAAWWIARSNVPVGLYAGQPLHTIFGAKRLYFHVPAGLKQFTLSVAGSGGETVRLNVFAPDGRQAASAQTTQQSQVDLNVPVADASDAVWSLELGRADTGVLEDSTIRLDPKLPPVLSLVPEEVFRQGKTAAK